MSLYENYIFPNMIHLFLKTKSVHLSSPSVPAPGLARPPILVSEERRRVHIPVSAALLSCHLLSSLLQAPIEQWWMLLSSLCEALIIVMALGILFVSSSQITVVAAGILRAPPPPHTHTRTCLAQADVSDL